MSTPESPAVGRKIFSVSELNREIKQILEKKYAFVWISGEISNISRAASGHVYMTLKDRNAQISSVVFRTQTRMLDQTLSNGMQVTGFGRISVYEPRGTYQIILEYLEKSGAGELLAELEKVKAKLKDEGLFDSKYKKPLPFLPSKIAIITSPTGAAIEDILNIAAKRFESIPIEIIPVTVQGNNAANEIVSALELVNRRKSADVIILTRGGGSVEDLHPFNSEQVARAVFAASIPVVSAVGHEIDFTLADFVADLRAPTPSAAVELIMPVRKDLAATVATARQRMVDKMQFILDQARDSLSDLSRRLVHSRVKIDDAIFRIDELEERLVRAMMTRLRQCETQLTWWQERLNQSKPEGAVHRLHANLEGLVDRLDKIIRQIMERRHQRLRSSVSALTALDPNAILKRGYSITRLPPENKVVRSVEQVVGESELEIILSDGTLRVKNLPQWMKE